MSLCTIITIRKLFLRWKKQPLLLLHGSLSIMQQHAFICICTAKSAVPAARGCLRGSDPQAILLSSFLVWRCILVPMTGTWHVMSTLSCSSPSFSHCHSPLLSLCSVLTTFCKWSWLHHVAAFIWSEIPQAAPAQGTRQHFASWCNYGSRHYSKKQQLNGVWREMWPSHIICLIAAMPSLASTSKVWCMEGTLLQMETCKVASCKAAQREGHSPRKPWTSHGS